MEYQKPIDPAKVYGIVGFLLGTLGSGAVFMTVIVKIYYREYLMHQQYNSRFAAAPLLLFGVIAICSFAGTGMGLAVGVLMKYLSRYPWTATVLLSPVAGLVWAIITGGSGGVPFLIIGAVPGAVFAAPIGIIGFTAFAAVYEPLSRQRPFTYPKATLLALAVSVPLALVMLIVTILTFH